jgi:hypothetical protein
LILDDSQNWLCIGRLTTNAKTNFFDIFSLLLSHLCDKLIYKGKLAEAYNKRICSSTRNLDYNENKSKASPQLVSSKAELSRKKGRS